MKLDLNPTHFPPSTWGLAFMRTRLKAPREPGTVGVLAVYAFRSVDGGEANAAQSLELGARSHVSEISELKLLAKTSFGVDGWSVPFVFAEFEGLWPLPVFKDVRETVDWANVLRARDDFAARWLPDASRIQDFDASEPLSHAADMLAAAAFSGFLQDWAAAWTTVLEDADARTLLLSRVGGIPAASFAFFRRGGGEPPARRS